MTDVNALTADLVRYWRGDVPQLEFSLELGFNSNVVGNWEVARSACTAACAMRMAWMKHPDSVEDLTRRLSEFRLATRTLLTPAGIALLVRQLVDDIGLAKVADRSRLSRHTVGRWCRGVAEPRFPAFLRLLDAAHLLEFVVSRLAPGLRLPNELPDGISLDESETIVGLMTTRYQALKTHDDGVLSYIVGQRPHEVRRHLDKLARLGIVERTTGIYRLVQGNKLRRRSQEDLHTYIADRIGRRTPYWSRTMLVVGSEEELASIRTILERARLEILEVCSHDDDEVDRSRVHLVGIGIVPLDPGLTPDATSPP